ncbi:hypothetical protein HKX48_001482 [Thoreauomyces humboldtii]|nr:hypothetical protein HKX48_001482 [Thoreauomyces humboldtii]
MKSASAILSLALAASVLAQSTTPVTTPAAAATPVASANECTDALFGRCLIDNDSFKTGTCDPFLTGGAKANVTLSNDCLCIYHVHRQLCYQDCTGNSTVQAEEAADQEALTSICATAGLNPGALPPVAPWVTSTSVAVVATSTPVVASSASAASGASASTTPAPSAAGTATNQKSAAPSTSGLGKFVGVAAAGLFAAVLYL